MAVHRAVTRPAALAGLLVACAVLASVPAARAANQVRISQVYGGGGGSTGTFTRDYVELFNSGPTAVQLGGWSLQYGSATGSIGASSYNVFAFPSATIQPHAYLLVQCGAVGTAGVPISPAPDLGSPTTAMSMSATSGKIALVGNTTYPTACTSTAILDLVAYGTATCPEGGAAAGVLTSTTAAFRRLEGCQDTDHNANDFTVGPPIPRNSASPAHHCLAAEPTAQPSGLSFSSVLGASMTVGWSANGDGSNRLVLVREGAAVAAAPVDGTTYSASATFGEGSRLDDGSYVAYDGTGMSVPLDGLTAGTTYHVAVFEFNGTVGTENYLATDPLAGSRTPAVPTSVELASAPDPSASGAPVTLTATVTPPDATGTVTFLDGGSTLDTGTLSGGTATVSVSGLAVGVHGLFARYEGDAAHVGSLSAEHTHRVSPSSTLAGTYAVGVGRDFETLTDAIADVQLRGIGGPVVLSLVDAGYPSETFPIVLRPVTGASAENTVTIRPAPGVVTTLSGASSGCVLELSGADHVVVDGSNTPGGTTRDLSIENTSADGGTAALCLFTLDGTDGASHDVIRNVELACGADQTLAGAAETFGILSSGGAVSVASDGVGNDANTFANLQVTRARWGIYLRGAEATPGSGNAVTGCLVGPASFGVDQIGRGGIVLEHQVGASVTDNEVRFAGVAYLPPIQAAAATQVVGIALGGTRWYPAPSATVLSGSVVARNRVHDLAEDRPGGSAVGILLAASGTTTGNLIANNEVFSVRACASNPQTAAGIALCGGDGDSVVFNSVSLNGDLDPDPSTTGTRYALGLRVLSGATRNLVLRDNVLSVDVRTNSGAGRCASIMLPDPYDGSLVPPFTWGTGGSDHNAYHHGTGNLECIVGFTRSASGLWQFLELPDWQANFPGQDLASVSGDPRFVSPTGDLHVSTAGPVSVLANAGAPVGVAADLDGEARSAVAPDIGADEFAPAAADDIAAGWPVHPSAGETVPSAGPFGPVGRFFNAGGAGQAGVPVRCRVFDGGGSPAYDETVVVADWPAETGIDVAFPPATLAAGTYTLELRAALPGDAVPSNDAVTAGFTLSAPLAGEYRVGAGRDFPSLTAAIAALEGAGVAGPVSFLLTDATYSGGESYPITVRPFAGASDSNTVTVRPDAGVTATISGSASSSLIRMLGVDHFVLDGSNTPGGTSRDLTVSVTGVASAVAAITLEATLEGDGARHDVVRNCVIRGAGTNVQTGIYMGSLYGAGDSPERAQERPPAGEPTGPLAVGPKVRPRAAPDGVLSPQVIQMLVAAAPNTDDRIENNDIAGVRTVILVYGNSQTDGTSWFPGDARNAFVGNLIGVAPPGAPVTTGASIGTQQDLTFEGNDIRNATATGLMISDCAGASVTRNRIHGFASSASAVDGIVVNGGQPDARNLFANNMVYDLRTTHPAPAVSGITVWSDPGARFLFNTVYLAGDIMTGTGAAYALFDYFDDPAREVRGNVLVVDGSGGEGSQLFARWTAAPSISGTADHNDLYVRATGSTGVIGFVGGQNYTTLAEWRAATGLDAHSIGADPQLLSATDPHVDARPGRPIPPLANAAAPDAAVTTDIDGDPRSPSAPDIGADEFATYTLAASATHGSIACDPPGPLHNPGTVVTLTASPEAGYAFYTWGGDASGRANPLALVMDADKTVTALFDLPGTAVAFGPPAGSISTAHPCVAVPCTVARADALPMRGFRVGVRLSANLALCGPGITPGTYLSGSAPGAVTTFQVTDRGGGAYLVEGSLVGAPCGATGSSGTLFDVHVGKATGAADGVGAVTPDTIAVADCDSIAIPAGAGVAATLTIDTTPPARLLTLAAAQRTAGNGPGGTTAIDLSWSGTGADTTTLYRAPYGHYPEYDDLGGGVPTLPSYPPPAPWSLAGTVVGTTRWTDESPGGRDLWYYVAFLRDTCGNVSVASNRTAGTLSYHLGDVHDGGTDCAGDDRVGTEDVSFFGAHYGAQLGGPGDPLACLDVGPTTDRHVDTRPTTDDWLDFEDLMVFAVNFQAVSVPPLAAMPAPGGDDAVALAAPGRVVAGQEFAATLRLRGSGALAGVSLRLGWDGAVCEPLAVRPGELLPAGHGLVLSPGPGGVDAVALGRGVGLVGEGELATVTFRARASGDPGLGIASARGRDRDNRDAPIAVAEVLTPRVTTMAHAAPNPFAGATTLRFALARGGPVELCVYSVEGRRVGTLVSGVLEPGFHAYRWEAAGNRPGLYYARLSTPDGRYTRALVYRR